MKKSYCVLFVVMVMSLGLAAQSTAADAYDVVGDYLLELQSKLKVKGLSKEESTESDTLSLRADQLQGNIFSFAGGASGTFSMLKKGKKIQLELGQDGRDQVKRSLAQSIADLINAKKGLTGQDALSGEDITITLDKVKISPIKIDKKTNFATGKFKVIFGGVSSAIVQGQQERRKFSLKGKFTIQSREDPPIISDDSLLFSSGIAEPPPLFIDPEQPASNTPVTIKVDVSEATAIYLTVSGNGCGDITDVSGDNPLEITGNVAKDGYCDLRAEIVFPEAESLILEGRFEIQSSEPQVPPVTVAEGIWVKGALPETSVDPDTPTIVDLEGPSTFINGGSSTYEITYDGQEEIVAILVQVSGYGGYYWLPVTESNGSLSFTLNFDSDIFDQLATASLALDEFTDIRGADGSSMELAVKLIDKPNNTSAPRRFIAEGERVGEGDVKVSVSWNSETDVDLHAFEPNGEHIYYGNPKSSSGGQLDLDSNPGCNIDGIQNENIVWPEDMAPNGEYTVKVHMYKDCGIGRAGGTVKLKYCGDSSPERHTFQLGATGDSKTWKFTSECKKYKVSGIVKYEDFVAHRTGFAASGTMVPVRLALVEVVRSSDEAVLARSGTNDLGKFDITFRNDDEPGYYVQVYAKPKYGSEAHLDFWVEDFNDNFYIFGSETIDETREPDKKDLKIEISRAMKAEAMNIYDVGIRLSEYVRQQTGNTPPQLIFRWEAGKKTPAARGLSHYNDEKGAIYVDGRNEEGYCDCVIAHEYGHFVLAKLSTDDSLAPPHSPYEIVEPRAAWSEGWATFFACAALGRTSAVRPPAPPDPGMYFSIETLPAEVPLGNKDSKLNGDLSEAVVSAVLMDIYDRNNESKDTINGKSVGIWNVVTTYMKDGYPKFRDRGVAGRDLVDFLDGWFCLGYNEKGSNDNEGIRGIVKGMHKLSYDFPTLASCK